MSSKKKKNTSEPTKKPKKQSKATKLIEQISSQKNELADQKDKYLRLKAEFDNYRRRKEKEAIDLLKYDGESVIKQFLSVLDDWIDWQKLPKKMEIIIILKKSKKVSISF